MSDVSAVTLFCSVVESDAPSPILSDLNEWLKSHGVDGKFCEISEHYGGTKHPQSFVFAAGLNHFPRDDFRRFVQSMKWEEPNNVVLVMQPEDGPTTTFIPPATDIDGGD